MLTAGASAVYGSDATAGVINVILRRGFDGAMTQVGVSTSPQIGYVHTSFAQLFGRTWDTGNVTVSYTRTDAPSVAAEERSYYTQDFRPWGLQDSRPRGASIPGTVHVGNAITRQLARPWASQLKRPANQARAGGLNQCGRNRVLRQLQYVLAVMLLHSNGARWRRPDLGRYRQQYRRRSHASEHRQQLAPRRRETRDSVEPVSRDVGPAADPKLVRLPRAGLTLRRGLLLGPEGQADLSLGERSGQAGALHEPPSPDFQSLLPGRCTQQFKGRLQLCDGSAHDHPGRRARRTASPLDSISTSCPSIGRASSPTRGPTIRTTDTPRTRSIRTTLRAAARQHDCRFERWSLRSRTPSPTPFPISTSSAIRTYSPATIPRRWQYIKGYRLQDEQFKIEEWAANFSGPIFQLPGGPLEGAIAFQALKYDWWYRNLQNDNTHGTHVVNNILDVGYQTSYAIFGQLNIPVVGPEMGIPLVENFLIELGYRYDHYDNLDDPVFVRKIAANWTLGYGFTLRGAWGESFRVPSFAEAGARSRVAGLNPLGLAANATDQAILGCLNQGIPRRQSRRGSSRLLDRPAESDLFVGRSSPPTRRHECRAHRRRRCGDLKGPRAQPAEPSAMEHGVPLGAARQGFLAGLNADVSWFRLEFKGLIDNVELETSSPDNPLFRDQYTVIPRPDLPITAPENAEFLSLVEQLAFYPGSGGFAFDPDAIPERQIHPGHGAHQSRIAGLLGHRFRGALRLRPGRVGFDECRCGGLLPDSSTRAEPARRPGSMTDTRIRTPEIGCSASAIVWAGPIRPGTSPCSRTISATAQQAKIKAST